MQAILMKASGRSSKSPIVILTGLSLSYNQTLRSLLSRTLSAAWKWTVCNCTPRNIIRTIFGEKVSMAVAIVLVAFMWWHIVSIDDSIAGGEAVATDCLYATPWGIVWAIKGFLAGCPEEGDEK